jgi:hypothetical protein
MNFLNPFARLGVRTPSIAAPQLPASLRPFMTPPTTTVVVQPGTRAPQQFAPITPLTFGTPPNIKLPTQTVIPRNAQGQPDMSLLPQGYSTNWGPTTPSWLQKPMPPAPTMTRLTTPAPTKATTRSGKTPVVAPKAK